MKHSDLFDDWFEDFCEEYEVEITSVAVQDFMRKAFNAGHNRGFADGYDCCESGQDMLYDSEL